MAVAPFEQTLPRVGDPRFTECVVARREPEPWSSGMVSLPSTGSGVPWKKCLPVIHIP